MMRPTLLPLAALCLAASAAAETARRPMTVDDLWAIQRVGTPALSPDGQAIAYTVTTYDLEENRGNADIWTLPAAGGTPRRLTTSKASEGPGHGEPALPFLGPLADRGRVPAPLRRGPGRRSWTSCRARSATSPSRTAPATST